MDSISTLYHLLKTQDQLYPNQAALFAPHKDPLSYHQLFELVNQTIRFLHEHAIQKNDSVSIVLPNGPEMAAAFLAVASCAAAAPLNPNYRPNEFDFYFTDLNARALITLKGWETPARQIASQKGLVIFELEPLTQNAGNFILHAPHESRQVTLADLPQGDDIALILHTSGTTSRPKMVPLSQQNLSISARKQSPIPASDGFRPLFKHYAPLPYPRTVCGLAGLIDRRGQCHLHPGFFCARLFRLDEYLSAHLVYGRSDHAPIHLESHHRQP